MTGSPLKDCMTALEQTNGDIEASKDFLRKKGLAQAEKKVDRLASEGLVGVIRDTQSNRITMVQLACETDFVAKTSRFQDGLRQIMETIHFQKDLEITGDKCIDQDFIKKLCDETNLNKPLDDGLTSQNIADGLMYTISKTQENCQLVKLFQTNWNPEEGEVLQAYIHS